MMKRTKPRLAACICLLAVLLFFIWGNSSMPGEASGSLSRMVGEFLKKLLPFLPMETESWQYLLRKAAHFSEFCALGMCVCWLFGMTLDGRWIHFWLPLGCGAAVACTDEFIQRFSPGRYPSIVDVTIDTSGVLTGIILLLAGHTVCTRIKKRKE